MASRNLPSKNEIIRYWNWNSISDERDEATTRLYRLGKYQPQKYFNVFDFFQSGEEVDLEDIIFLDFCFACGLHKLTQRAHILASSKGGPNSVENLHLLCKSCHDESELLSGEKYWNWFKHKDENLALEYWIKDKQPHINKLISKMRAIKSLDQWEINEIKEFTKENMYLP